jgi:CheY-like chemotaxis protein
MDGDISVQSQPGEGTTFRVSFQLTSRQATPEMSEHTSAQTEKSGFPSSMKGNILLVEDNPVNQIVTTQLLEHIGLHITIAANGQEAIDHWVSGDYDLILMDCQMPILDGYAATRIIREQETGDTGKTPIVALTAHALADDKIKCLNAGMDDYLVKPVTREKLYETLLKYLPDNRKRKSA